MLLLLVMLPPSYTMLLWLLQQLSLLLFWFLIAIPLNGFSSVVHFTHPILVTWVCWVFCIAVGDSLCCQLNPLLLLVFIVEQHILHYNKKYAISDASVLCKCLHYIWGVQQKRQRKWKNFKFTLRKINSAPPHSINNIFLLVFYSLDVLLWDNWKKRTFDKCQDQILSSKFSHVNGVSFWMVLSVCFVHHFDPDWNISSTVGWIAITTSTRIQDHQRMDHQ